MPKIVPTIHNQQITNAFSALPEAVAQFVAHNFHSILVAVKLMTYPMKKALIHACDALFCAAFSWSASGHNAANTSIDVYTNQGNQWFMARRVKT